MQLLPPPLRPRLPRARSKSPQHTSYKPTAPLGARPRSTKAISAPCGYSLCSYSSPQSPIALSSSTPQTLTPDPPSTLSPILLHSHLSNYLFPPPLRPTLYPQIFPSPFSPLSFPQITSFPSPPPQRYLQRLGLTHDLSRTLQPLGLRGYHFISQGTLAHPWRSYVLSPRERHTSEPNRGYI